MPLPPCVSTALGIPTAFCKVQPQQGGRSRFQPVSADSSVSWNKTLSPADTGHEGACVLCKHGLELLEPLIRGRPDRGSARTEGGDRG